MTNRQGYNWMPKHDQFRWRVLEHIRRVKPAFGVILTEDYTPISEAWAAHPHKICARVYEIDDGAGAAGRALDADPRAAANDLLNRYLVKIAQWREQAAAAGKPFPDVEHLYISAWNEPNQHTSYAKIVEGNIYLCEMATAAGVRVLAVKLGVGHPANLNADGSVDWSDFNSKRLEAAINGGGHIVGLHAYFQAEGPNHSWRDEAGKLREDYPYLAGRHHSWPLQTPLALDETGVDGGIYGRNVSWGWQNYNIPVATYAGMLQWTHDHMDPRGVAQCPYGLDYQNDEWWGFNYVTALDQIELWVATTPANQPHTIHIPVISQPVPDTPTAQPPESQPPVDNWSRSRDFVLAREGGYQANPDDNGNWTGGVKGQGELKGTKYGISAASYPNLDIRNLALSDAIAIYKRDYWQASGADQLPWPACLLVFDTAVLHGVGAAKQWLTEVGPNPYAFAAKRLCVYTNSSNWHAFGAGWVNRVATLLESM